MPRRLWIIGAGSFGREVFDWATHIRQQDPRWDIAGFLDDNLHALEDRPCNLKLQGSIDTCDFTADDCAVVAIANTAFRAEIVRRLAGRVAFETLIHPAATVGSHSTLGEGCILCPQAVVTTNARLGEHVHANLASTITHDVTVGPFVTLSDHVDLCGGVTVEEGAFFGSHASVTPGRHVGRDAKVGAGAVVLQDVPAGTTVFGVPARVFARPTPPEGEDPVA